jgi:hypothetical protein
LHAARAEGDVDVSPCAGPFDEPDEGVSIVTMAYVFLINLMVVCPLIRLASISMKASEERRRQTSARVVAVNTASRFDVGVSRDR